MSTSTNKIINPNQCRAARALLNWSQSDLSAKSKVAKATIADFEREKRTPYDRTLQDIKRSFTENNIEFENTETTCGLRLVTKKS